MSQSTNNTALRNETRMPTSHLELRRSLRLKLRYIRPNQSTNLSALRSTIMIRTSHLGHKRSSTLNQITKCPRPSQSTNPTALLSPRLTQTSKYLNMRTECPRPNQNTNNTAFRRKKRIGSSHLGIRISPSPEMLSLRLNLSTNLTALSSPTGNHRKSLTAKILPD